jgi:biopolymer transport protein ExbB/TolQ
MSTVVFFIFIAFSVLGFFILGLNQISLDRRQKEIARALEETASALINTTELALLLKKNRDIDTKEHQAFQEAMTEYILAVDEFLQKISSPKSDLTDLADLFKDVDKDDLN